jgi:hypothetical protein
MAPQTADICRTSTQPAGSTGRPQAILTEMPRFPFVSPRPRAFRTYAMKSRAQLAVLALVLVFAPNAQSAGAFSAVVSGYRDAGCFLLAFPVYRPSLEWVLSLGRFTVPSLADDIEAIDSADGDAVYGIVRDSPGLRIVRLLPGEASLHDAPQDVFDGMPGSAGQAIAVAKGGRIFASVRMPAPPSQLAVISRDGYLERLVELPDTAGSIAVGADGCTVYYADRKSIRRLNACSGEPLPLLATLPNDVTDLAILSTGNVLASTWQDLMELGVDGLVIRTFPRPLVTRGEFVYGYLDAIAVSPDETTIGIAKMRGCEDAGVVIGLAFSDGHELWRQETSKISTATGLVLTNVPPQPTKRRSAGH